ncbi:DUF5819 family protein [Micromonospora sp. NPDC051141]|uniref:DUF5819 family protein n=1 Tax=Micromonospora sp. NPDC051141 TaxID=3364284 RepID=UPI0037BBA171
MPRLVIRPPGWTQSGPARVAQRAARILPLLVVTAYAVSVIGYNLPPSPLKVRLQSTLDAVVDPYLTQRWRLFAPNPPNGNYDGWLQVEYRTGGTTTTSPVLSLTQPLIAEAKAHRLFPPRVDRTVLNLGYSLSDIATSETKLERLIASRQNGQPLTDPADPSHPISVQEASILPAGWQELEGAGQMSDAEYLAAARESLAGARKQVSGQIGRLASMMVPGVELDGDPVRVRVFYTWTAILRFSERHEADPEQDPPIRIADTGWMSYQPPER